VVSSISENVNAANFAIYPNPTRGNVYLDLPMKPEANNLLQIYNLTGQLVREFRIQNKLTLIDISELDRSVYFFKYQNSIKKIVLTN